MLAVFREHCVLGLVGGTERTRSVRHETGTVYLLIKTLKWETVKLAFSLKTLKACHGHVSWLEREILTCFRRPAWPSLQVFWYYSGVLDGQSYIYSLGSIFFTPQNMYNIQGKHCFTVLPTIKYQAFLLYIYFNQK